MISDVDIRDWDTIEIKTIKENKDGSADIELNVGPKALQYMIAYSFTHALKRAIKEDDIQVAPNS